MKHSSAVSIAAAFAIASSFFYPPMNKERPDTKSPGNIVAYVFLSILGLIVLFWMGSFLETRIFTPETEGPQSSFSPPLAQEPNDN